MQHIENNRVVKLVLVVREIEKKAQAFASLLGIEAPAVVSTPPAGPVPPACTELRGTRIRGAVKLANIPMGPVTLELIEPMDGVSPWAEHLRDRGEGIFSIVMTVDDFEGHQAFMNERGMPLYHVGEYGTGRYAYFDTLSDLGITLCLQNLQKRFSA
jgi:methylmalonyl-CoA/ethylmalonyl-CoA epimerase